MSFKINKATIPKKAAIGIKKMFILVDLSEVNLKNKLCN